MRLNRALNHKIWCLAWPMIISNISVPLLGIIDTAILGHLDNARYLAAVAIGSSILSLLFWGFAFLRMGTTGLSAQALGASEHDQSRLILWQSVLLGLLLGVLIILISPLLVKLGLYLISPPADTEALAASYTQIRLFSAPAMLANFAMIGWLIGRQNTRAPLMITLLINGLNIALDFLFVIGFDMKSDGAALATVIAEFSGMALALHLLKRELERQAGTLDRHQLLRWSGFRRLLAINRQIFVRTLALLGSFVFFTAQGAAQGEVMLAANTILMNLLLLTAYGLDGFANAAEALVGNSIGQRREQEFLDTCLHCCVWSMGTAGLFTLMFWAAGPVLIATMTSLPAVQSQALSYLPWLVVLPLVAVWTYLLDGIFIGATQTGAMQQTMLFSVLLVYLPGWYFTQHWGNHGLWFAFLLLNVSRSLTMAAMFFRYNRLMRWWPQAVQN